MLGILATATERDAAVERYKELVGKYAAMDTATERDIALERYKDLVEKCAMIM